MGIAPVGGNCPGGNLHGWEFTGWELPGWELPCYHIYIYKRNKCFIVNEFFLLHTYFKRRFKTNFGLFTYYSE